MPRIYDLMTDWGVQEAHGIISQGCSARTPRCNCSFPQLLKAWLAAACTYHTQVRGCAGGVRHHQQGPRAAGVAVLRVLRHGAQPALHLHAGGGQVGPRVFELTCFVRGWGRGASVCQMTRCWCSTCCPCTRWRRLSGLASVRLCLRGLCVPRVRQL